MGLRALAILSQSWRAAVEPQERDELLPGVLPEPDDRRIIFAPGVGEFGEPLQGGVFGRGRVVLGLWAGDGGEGAKHWLNILTEIKNRGAGDVLMLVCDGLRGLPDAVETVWPATTVQTCVVHLLRNSFR